MEATGKFSVELSYNKIGALVGRMVPLVLIILAVIIILPGLGAGSLRDWDEAIYAQVSREIVQSNNWITLHQGYEPYFQKPPLLMWSTAIFYKLFGINEFWSRATSALSGILLIWITYLGGKAAYGNRTGFLAGLILLGSHEFVFQARNGTTNMPLALFVFSGVFAYLRLRDGGPKWWYLIFISCALAFMVKFWAGLVLPAVLTIVLILDHKVSATLRSRHFWLGLLLAGLIVVPWHVLVYLQNGRAFLDVYVTHNLFERSFTVLEGHAGSSLYYLDIMRRFFSPWFFLVPFAIALGIKEMIDQQGESSILVIEILFILGLYTFVVNTKICHYIFPIYPALSILMAQIFVQAFSTSKSHAFTWLITAALFATTIAQDKLLIVLCIIAAGLAVLIEKGLLSRRVISRFITTLIFTSFLMVSITGYVLGNHRLSIFPIYGLQVTPAARIAALAGSLNPSKEDPLIGLSMQEDWDTDFAVEGPTAMFYSNRPMEIVESWDALETLMADRGDGEMIIAEKYLDRISKDFDILVIERADPLVYARFSR